MQTFLSSYDLKENAKCLDGKRLFKQLIEAKTLLDIIVNKKTKSWENHPACLMWKDNPEALFWYIHSIWEECKNRGIAKKSELFDRCVDLITQHDKFFEYRSSIPKFPSWWGREDITKSHQSRLLCKGRIDMFCNNIKTFYKIKNMDNWLKEKFGKAKNQLKDSDTNKLWLVIITHNIPLIGVNHYAQFNWDVPYNLEYVWPSKE